MDTQISKYTENATIENAVYNGKTNTLTVRGKYIPTQTLNGYAVEDWGTVVGRDGLPCLDIQLWDERSEEYPEDFGFQYVTLEYDTVRDNIFMKDFYSVPHDKITFIDYPENTPDTPELTTNTLGWCRLRVGDKSSLFLIKVVDGVLQIIPDYDELENVAPDGTVMEVYETDLSIHPFKQKQN